jgi:hypothetical protein
MLNLNLLIIDTPFTAITEASIKKNMPGKGYTIVGLNGGIIRTALEECDNELTLVVMGGVILELGPGDIPPLQKLSEFHICAARSQVYSDHPTLSRFYSYTESPCNQGQVDLGIFIINPKLWTTIPDRDAGALRDKKLMKMPRYMNHKTDTLVSNCLSPYEALKYGMLGYMASAFNYLDILQKGSATTIEGYAYRLDKLAEYSDDPEIKILALKPSITKLRERLFIAQRYQDGRRDFNQT